MSQIAFFDVDNTLLRGYSGFYTTLLLIQKKIIKKRRLSLAFFYATIAPVYKGNLKKMYEIAAVDMAGTHIDDILKVGRECFEASIKPRLFQEGIALLEEHKKQGHPVYLLTSGPYMTIRILGEFLGAEGRFGGGPIIDEKGYLTRQVKLPLCYREGKVLAAEEILKEHGARWEDCYYYGDSIDDHFILEKVGFPHMVNPDKKLLKMGRKKNWPVLKFEKVLSEKKVN